MVLSPVVFPLATTGWTGTVMRLNPLTPQLLLLVWMVYRLAMPILIERMSA